MREGREIGLSLWQIYLVTFQYAFFSFSTEYQNQLFSGHMTSQNKDYVSVPPL